MVFIGSYFAILAFSLRALREILFFFSQRPAKNRKARKAVIGTLHNAFNHAFIESIDYKFDQYINSIFCIIVKENLKINPQYEILTSFYLHFLYRFSVFNRSKNQHRTIQTLFPFYREQRSMG